MAPWENPRMSGTAREREKMENIHLDVHPPEEVHPPRNPYQSLQQLSMHTFHRSACKAKLCWQRHGFTVLWGMPALLNASSEAAQLWVKESVAYQSLGRGLGDLLPKAASLCCMNLKLYPNNDRTHLSNFIAHLNVTLYWWRSFKFSFFWLCLQVAINILLAQD